MIFNSKHLMHGKIILFQLSRCKQLITKRNLLKRFMGRFSVICPLFHPVKLILYTSLHLINKTDKIHRCSKSKIVIPIECYIVFSGSLVHKRSKNITMAN